jgi:hypothetical protein
MEYWNQLRFRAVRCPWNPKILNRFCLGGTILQVCDATIQATRHPARVASASLFVRSGVIASSRAETPSRLTT